MTNPAGFWVRLLASILDGLIVGIPVAAFAYFVTGNWDDEAISSPLTLVYSILLPVIWHGYTVGKRIMNIRIAKVNGNKVGLGTMLMRTIVAGLVYVLTLGIGLIVSAFMVGIREDKRAIHDFIAGTYVTHNLPDEEY
ncbi:MAG: RDD family protein [Paenisporosarcina sp.]